MEPSNLIIWAMFLGLAWLIFASITGADEWLRSLLGTSKTSELEARISALESRVDALEKNKAK